MRKPESRPKGELKWIETSRKMPRDGQSVLAKNRYLATPKCVTFRRNPTPRWEDAGMAYQYEYFEHWAEDPS